MSEGGRTASAFHRALVLAGEPPCYTSTKKGIVYCPNYGRCAAEQKSCRMFGMYLGQSANATRKLPHGFAPSRVLYRQQFPPEDSKPGGQQGQGKRGEGKG